MSQKIQVQFYPLTNDTTSMLRKGKLTAAEWRIWSYLVEVDPWGGLADASAKQRYQDLDSLDVMSQCDCSRATFYRAITKFQKLGLFDIQDKGFSIRNLTGVSKLKATNKEKKLNKDNCSQKTEVSETRTQSQNCKSSLKNENLFSEMRKQSQNCENQSPKPPSDKGYNSPQTIQNIQTIQTATEEGKKVISENSSSEISENVLNRDSLSSVASHSRPRDRAQEREDESPQPMSSLSNVLTHTTEIKNGQLNLNRPAIQTPKQHSQNTSIPDDIKEKLQQINIPLDERVRGAINKYHPSQILGAIDHVRDTWETINDPKKIFLYQLPKQKVEQLGTRGKVYRASDEGGYSIERIKKMYPYNWREAAKHFGVTVDE